MIQMSSREPGHVTIIHRIYEAKRILFSVWQTVMWRSKVYDLPKSMCQNWEGVSEIIQVSWSLVWCISSIPACQHACPPWEVSKENSEGWTSFRAWATMEGCTFWKEVTMHSSRVRSGALFSTFLRADDLHKLLGILHERFPCFPLYIYSIIYLYYDGLMGIYFILCVKSNRL